MTFHPAFRFEITLFLILELRGLGMYFYSAQECYAVQTPQGHITPDGQPYTTAYRMNTVNSYRSEGTTFLFLSGFIGIEIALYQ